jgi:hypothetical protein
MKRVFLYFTLSTFRGFHRVFGGLDIRPDVVHREALVFLAGTGGALPQVLLCSIKLVFLATVNAHILARSDLVACLVNLVFCQKASPILEIYRTIIYCL